VGEKVGFGEIVLWGVFVIFLIYKIVFVLTKRFVWSDSKIEFDNDVAQEHFLCPMRIVKQLLYQGSNAN
jgi:hypothetical protein